MDYKTNGSLYVMRKVFESFRSCSIILAFPEAQTAARRSCVIVPANMLFVVMSSYGPTHTGKAPWDTAYLRSLVLHFGQICSFI